MLQKAEKMHEGHIYPISALQLGSLHGQLPVDDHAGGRARGHACACARPGTREHVTATCRGAGVNAAQRLFTSLCKAGHVSKFSAYQEWGISAKIINLS